MLSRKPKKRSRLRRFLGRHYFITKRLLSWYLSKDRYATHRQKEHLPYPAAQHRTPLHRSLRGVDMWLQENKIVNLKLATAKIDGIILQPDETFSLWRLVGRPTEKRGYLLGMILSEGTIQVATGGGLCQLGNLLYWLTLHTPLTVTERWRHSYDVFPDSNRTQPFGSGATLAYNYIDLQIKNNTKQTYQLSVWLDDRNLQGCWRTTEPQLHTYEVYEAKHWITHEWWGGYLRHNELHRKVLAMNEAEIADEFVTENHAIMMYEPLLNA